MSERADRSGVTLGARSHVPRDPGAVVGSADAFFLHVEEVRAEEVRAEEVRAKEAHAEDAGTPRTGAAQIAGGIALLHPSDDQPTLSDIRRLAHDEIPHLPRFAMRLAPTSTWRRPRWVDAGEPDLTWHVTERRAGSLRGLEQIVAEVAAHPFPRDRPLWRVVWARDVGPDGRSALVLMQHHALGDGVGTVTNALQFMRPRTALPTIEGGPGWVTRAAATAQGLAQLAADGRPRGRLGAGCGSSRDYATARLDLYAVRRAAESRHLRVTDLVLALVADAVAATCPDLARDVGGELRVAVPRLVSRPPALQEPAPRPGSRRSSESSNTTGAVMVDVPVDGRPIEDLLGEMGHRTGRLRRPTRAMAARFVMTAGLKVLPEPAAGWFARTVYGRSFFHGIVTNFPGPTTQLSVGGVPIDAVYPILPLAPGAPLALGALSWHGVLALGLATDPAVLDGHALLAHLTDTAAGLMVSARRGLIR